MTTESNEGRLKRSAARLRQMAATLESMTTLECGNLALEILGVEIELAALRLLFQQNCMGTGTP